MSRPVRRACRPAIRPAQVLLAAIALSPALAAAQSADTKFYFGVAAGRSHQSIDCAGTSDCHRAATAFKGWAGWPLVADKRVAIELVYDDLGTAKTETATGSVDYDARFVGVGLAGRADFTPFFGGVLRGGWARGSTTSHGETGGVPFSTTRNGTNHAYLGLAVDWRLNDNLRAQVGVDATRASVRVAGVESTHDVAAWSAGVVFSF